MSVRTASIPGVSARDGGVRRRMLRRRDQGRRAPCPRPRQLSLEAVQRFVYKTMHPLARRALVAASLVLSCVGGERPVADGQAESESPYTYPEEVQEAGALPAAAAPPVCAPARARDCLARPTGGPTTRLQRGRCVLRSLPCLT